jgi:hypothetical protein
MYTNTDYREICSSVLKAVYCDTSFNSFALANDIVEGEISLERFLNHRSLYGGSLCTGTAIEVFQRLPSAVQKCTRLHMPTTSPWHGFLGLWFKSEEEGVVIMDTHCGFGNIIVISDEVDGSGFWNSKPHLEGRYWIKDDGLWFHRDEPAPLLFPKEGATFDTALERSLCSIADYPFLAIISYLPEGGPKAFVKLELERKSLKFFDNEKWEIFEFCTEFEPNVALDWNILPNWVNAKYANSLHCQSLDHLKHQIEIIVLNYSEFMKYRSHYKLSEV